VCQRDDKFSGARRLEPEFAAFAPLDDFTNPSISQALSGFSGGTPGEPFPAAD